MKFTFNSLLWKVFSAIALFSIFSGTLLGISSFFKTKKLLISHLYERAQGIAANVQFFAESTQNTTDLARFVTALRGEENIQLIVIVRDQNGLIVASSKRQWLNKNIHTIDADISQQLEGTLQSYNTQWISNRSQKYYRIITPIIWAYGKTPKKVGSLLIQFDTERFQQETIRKATVQAAEMFFIVLILGLIISWLVWFTVLRQTRAIYNTMTEQSLGQDKKRSPVLSKDELGKLAIRLNRLLDFKAAAEQRLASAKEAAEQLAQSRVEFLAKVSHELRTPLTAIKGFTEQLQKEGLTLNQSREALEIIFKNTEYLILVINDLLEACRLEQGCTELNIVQYDLQELISDLTDIFSPLAKTKHLQFNIQIDLPKPYFVLCDPFRLKQVLVNLISNAIKFTEKGSVTLYMKEICCSLQNTKMNNILIEIIDTGIGIANDQIDKLFNPFVQADSSTSSQFGGSGLGLYISKNMIELMGGKIDVESFVNQGSSFTINLPVEKSDVSYDTERILHENAHQMILKGNILIADDMPDIRKLYEILLHDTELNIQFAVDGDDAVKQAELQHFDLFILDMQMPKKNGIETLQAIRKLGRNQPAIIATASLMPNEKKIYKEVGFTECLEKPIKQEQLFQYLGKVIGITSQQPVVSSWQESEIYQQMKREYLSQLADKISLLKKNVELENIEQVIHTSHQIKGSAGSFGLAEISSIAEKLEVAAKSGATEELKAIFVLLDVQYNSLTANK